MSQTKRTYRIIISGGGTGGHIYPAVAIAKAWEKRHPDSAILFVGAEGKMEMEKVPEAGFDIKGLPIAGLQRKLTLANLSFPYKVWKSLRKAKQILNEFAPDLALGVGGYASGPMLRAAQQKGIPTLIQEQNSYAGLTNKLLAKKANAICVAYPDMERYFPKDKVQYLGNPVRSDIIDLSGKSQNAKEHFGLDLSRPMILVLGGSLGARTINQAILQHMVFFESKGYQVLWQTGKYYADEMRQAVTTSQLKHIHPKEFIKEMDLAYASADLILSRAGALSVSELSLVGKPAIFIPSPNVAEDHQTKNALAFVDKGAAKMIKDNEAIEKVGQEVEELFSNPQTMRVLGQNIRKLAKPGAAEDIVNVMEKLMT
ncbi:undecaprenyldiphospho-muramoylpentapeptide beta-N-acetylglucosaminyltransferase [Pleomorphovibrio marinus]|uniref:undecaprenyldiphospho-muramoylpentapeptide beta-N-acetylglucosaminyltransferase n=1 Tax=Pleomorphovibrio marinus TaxID=2164132 RepID=UPI000E0A30CC|nr:undecaprenyldiphospho-muramoylpentapeptide beta-N-acetylglucosaminyltransferase [Pleomorphovibrio marinus]